MLITVPKSENTHRYRRSREKNNRSGVKSLFLSLYFAPTSPNMNNGTKRDMSIYGRTSYHRSIVGSHLHTLRTDCNPFLHPESRTAKEQRRGRKQPLNGTHTHTQSCGRQEGEGGGACIGNNLRHFYFTPLI